MSVKRLKAINTIFSKREIHILTGDTNSKKYYIQCIHVYIYYTCMYWELIGTNYDKAEKTVHYMDMHINESKFYQT